MSLFCNIKSENPGNNSKLSHGQNGVNCENYFWTNDQFGCFFWQCTMFILFPFRNLQPASLLSFILMSCVTDQCEVQDKPGVSFIFSSGHSETALCVLYMGGQQSNSISFPQVLSSLVYSTLCFPTSRCTRCSKGMGGDGKLAGKKNYSTCSQTVMDNLAASTHPSYFKRTQLPWRLYFTAGEPGFWLHFGAFIITCYDSCPLIFF